MDATAREALERRIRAQFDAGDKKKAATTLLEGYGRELLSFLIAHLHDREAASEVFSQFTEELWKSLGGFRWECSARVFCYTLARRAASHYIKDARRRRGRQVPLSRAGPLSAIEEKIRTATLAAARTETRTRIAELRATLPSEDQALILLRVSRQLDWKEIARVMSYEGETVPDEVLAREAARLRKRYQAAKDKLRRMAETQGLVGRSDEG